MKRTSCSDIKFGPTEADIAATDQKSDDRVGIDRYLDDPAMVAGFCFAMMALIVLIRVIDDLVGTSILG